jgi:TolA-binding protein
MDLPMTILIGAGVLIILVSLMMKKTSPGDGIRAEMEKSLQRFVLQVKRENESVAAGVHESKQELIREVEQLRGRLSQAERELAALAKQVQSLQAQANLSRQQEPAEEPTDTLALRERYRRVFELLQEGLGLDEIAKRLGAGRGEIELIVSLANPQQRRDADG